ncbi:glucosamine--fructose-6-phosphate aminotransferase [Steroidobacter denitrificans]|uniref:Glutamine--fructose-6-phosphate aminotransferase [isomerizing] n=1 Tax=Steroidobacter denitrificans TaxID=465721 RepID=A0A127F907_STEDE|nr:isomerizing glutamine--fructose-6-phosphate transaminase [Steroidobacter denitrificans]AMN46916.1 glucosamine--fructose-6-phosphate aminotransferase [Steroidobacter denitrificans]
MERDNAGYRYFMRKEILEQPGAVSRTLAGCVTNGRVIEAAFGSAAGTVFDRTEHVHIVACGTSYHAGVVARYFIEQICRLPCSIEVASEYRYRKPVTPRGSLLVALSQSGETPDTLAAARLARPGGFIASLAICNAPKSTLVRESDLVLLTHAGAKLALPATKTFTAQLVALGVLIGALVRRYEDDSCRERELVAQLLTLPAVIEATLALEPAIRSLARRLAEERHMLLLGRGIMYPVAMEGALKLKEVSYIQAEAYAAGELKHGPLALVDAAMPVIAMAPCDTVLEKLKSNLMEVRARRGQVVVFADPDSGLISKEEVASIAMPGRLAEIQCPVVYSVALQLLAFHVALFKGIDPDHPRGITMNSGRE